MRFLFVSLVVLMAACPVFAAGNGTSGAQFLQIIASPRAAAMGGAYTALCDDVNTIAFNPAGIAYLSTGEVALAQNNWIQGISNQYLAAAVPVRGFGTLGLEVNMLSVGDITRTDVVGNSDGTTFGSSNMSAGLSYAKAISKNFSAGVNIKTINETIDNVQASGYAADVGALFRASSKIDLGVAVQNIGAEIKFIDEADPLPLTLRGGLAYRPVTNVACTLDVVQPNDSGVYECVGLEYAAGAISNDKVVFPFRAGYRTGYDSGDLSGFSLGAGVLYNGHISVDLAWTPMGILGDSLKFGLGVRF